MQQQLQQLQTPREASTCSSPQLRVATCRSSALSFLHKRNAVRTLATRTTGALSLHQRPTMTTTDAPESTENTHDRTPIGLLAGESADMHGALLGASTNTGAPSVDPAQPRPRHARHAPRARETPSGTRRTRRRARKTHRTARCTPPAHSESYSARQPTSVRPDGPSLGPLRLICTRSVTRRLICTQSDFSGFINLSSGCHGPKNQFPEVPPRGHGRSAPRCPLKNLTDHVQT